MIMISVFLQSNDSGIFLFCSSEGNKTVGLNTTKAHVCSFWLLQACQGMLVAVCGKPHPILGQTHLAFLSISSWPSMATR